VGRARLVTADVSSPYHQPLAQILARSFGPVLVIRDELAAVDILNGLLAALPPVMDARLAE